MRPILESPVNTELLALTTPLVEHIYALHEAGGSYDPLLSQLSQLVGTPVTQYEVCSGFGSVSPESFAYDLLVRSIVIPGNLSHPEMLELVQYLLQPEQEELRTGFWLACLTLNTGDPRFSDLIYWPGEYFKDGDNSRELSAEEILRTAQANQCSYRGT